MADPSVPVQYRVGAILAAEAETRFAGALAPSLGYRRRNGPVADHLVAAVARRDGRPVGRALGQVVPGTDVGEVLCLLVAEGERRRGVGSALLARLEVAIAGAGCPVVQGRYRSDWVGAAATERLLASAGWDPPVMQKLFYKGDLRAFDALPEIRAIALPEGYTVDAWDTLTGADRAHVEAIVARDPAARATSPFQRADLVSRDFSVWIRYRGEVVGWMALLQPTPTVMEYSGLYVVRAHRPSRAGIAAVAAAVRRQAAAIDRHERDSGGAPGGPPRVAVFTVVPGNGPMRVFARKWIHLPEAKVTTVWLAGKRLAADGPATPTA